MTEREEALEEAAKIFEGQVHSEWFGHEAADAIRALKSSSPPPKGGEGWRIVPLEPTSEMIVAGCDAVFEGPAQDPDAVWDMWHAMIAAAPDGKATPPDEMGAEQPKAASEHLLTENARLREALEKIARWFGEFPATGKFWDKGEKEPMNYAACFGSNGERDFMREIARAALSERTE